MMKIFLGADHNGFDLKEQIENWLRESGYDVFDEGNKQYSKDDDFPQFAGRVVHAMRASSDKDPRGILICGSGQGMCMAANRFNGIRASLVWNQEEAVSSRNDDDSNVLCLPAREINLKAAQGIVTTWLNTPFAGATRFVRRIKEMDNLS